MKAEIKEILEDIKKIVEDENETPENMKKYIGGTFNVIELKALLDYITNLQDRTKELEAINEEHRKINGELREENTKLKNAFLHAIYFINNHTYRWQDTQFGEWVEKEEFEQGLNPRELINILLEGLDKKYKDLNNILESKGE